METLCDAVSRRPAPSQAATEEQEDTPPAGRMPPPDVVALEGKEVACWTHDQLEKLSKLNLKQRAMNLRDQIGADRLPALRLSAQPAALINWLLIAQCTICEAVGVTMTPQDWGAPIDVSEGETTYFGGITPRSQPTSQEPVAQLQRAPSYGQQGDVSGHEGVMAAAQAARLRNQGSLSFGDATAHDAPPQMRGARAMPSYGQASYNESPRPGTASSVSSIQAFEDSAAAMRRIRARNQGSFSFG